MAEIAFPANIVETLKLSLVELDGVTTVLGRALRMVDPNASVGVFATDWHGGEMGIGHPPEPLDNKYNIVIQLLIKHMNEEEALAQHSVLSKSIRVMVYRDPALRVRLPQLSEASSGVTERVQKWGVRAQRYLANELDGQFLFLSSTEVEVTTETGLM